MKLKQSTIIPPNINRGISTTPFVFVDNIAWKSKDLDFPEINNANVVLFLFFKKIFFISFFHLKYNKQQNTRTFYT